MQDEFGVQGSTSQLLPLGCSECVRPTWPLVDKPGGSSLCANMLNKTKATSLLDSHCDDWERYSSSHLAMYGKALISYHNLQYIMQCGTDQNTHIKLSDTWKIPLRSFCLSSEVYVWVSVSLSLWHWHKATKLQCYEMEPGSGSTDNS